MAHFLLIINWRWSFFFLTFLVGLPSFSSFRKNPAVLCFQVWKVTKPSYWICSIRLTSWLYALSLSYFAILTSFNSLAFVSVLDSVWSFWRFWLNLARTLWSYLDYRLLLHFTNYCLIYLSLEFTIWRCPSNFMSYLCKHKFSTTGGSLDIFIISIFRSFYHFF